MGMRAQQAHGTAYNELGPCDVPRGTACKARQDTAVMWTRLGSFGSWRVAAGRLGLGRDHAALAPAALAPAAFQQAAALALATPLAFCHPAAVASTGDATFLAAARTAAFVSTAAVIAASVSAATASTPPSSSPPPSAPPPSAPPVLDIDPRPPSSPLQSTRRSTRPCVREKPYAALFGLVPASRTGSQLMKVRHRRRHHCQHGRRHRRRHLRRRHRRRRHHRLH